MSPSLVRAPGLGPGFRGSKSLHSDFLTATSAIGSALESGSRGSEFESRVAEFFQDVGQLVGHLVWDQGHVGSSPTILTIYWDIVQQVGHWPLKPRTEVRTLISQIFKFYKLMQIFFLHF